MLQQKLLSKDNEQLGEQARKLDVEKEVLARKVCLPARTQSAIVSDRHGSDRHTQGK